MADTAAHAPLLAALRARNAATAGYGALIADYQAAAVGRRDLQVGRGKEGGAKKKGGETWPKKNSATAPTPRSPLDLSKHALLPPPSHSSSQPPWMPRQAVLRAEVGTLSSAAEQGRAASERAAGADAAEARAAALAADLAAAQRERGRLAEEALASRRQLDVVRAEHEAANRAAAAAADEAACARKRAAAAEATAVAEREAGALGARSWTPASPTGTPPKRTRRRPRRRYPPCPAAWWRCGAWRSSA